MDLMTLESYVEQYPEVIWALIAAAFFVLEVIVVSGIGFLFAALGALTVSILIWANILLIDSIWLHMFWFFVLSGAWTAILWVPLKMMSRPKEDTWENFKGTRATVGTQALNKNSMGRVKWSGTKMQALIWEHSEVEEIAPGTDVWVVDHEGSTLYVDIKKPVAAQQ